MGCSHSTKEWRTEALSLDGWIGSRIGSDGRFCLQFFFTFLWGETQQGFPHVFFFREMRQQFFFGTSYIQLVH